MQNQSKYSTKTAFPQRKWVRLSPDCYRYTGLHCSLTLCVKDRQAVFTQDRMQFTKQAMRVVYDYCIENEFPVYGCCFMPEHIHICTEATEEKSLSDFLRDIKTFLTRLGWQYGLKDGWLQRGAYDHFLRREENIKQVVVYIFQNPERKKLVHHWNDYPFLFSTVFTRGQLLQIA